MHSISVMVRNSEAGYEGGNILNSLRNIFILLRNMFSILRKMFSVLRIIFSIFRKILIFCEIFLVFSEIVLVFYERFLAFRETFLTFFTKQHCWYFTKDIYCLLKLFWHLPATVVYSLVRKLCKFANFLHIYNKRHLFYISGVK